MIEYKKKRSNNFIKLFLIITFIIIIYLTFTIQNLYNLLYINMKSFPINCFKQIYFYHKKNKYINNYNNKKLINITLSLDNNIIYETLVVMTSVLANNDQNKHFIIFYLLLSNDFDSRNIKIFESLKLKFQLIIYYYYIPDLFNCLKKWRYNSTAIYFKLLIPILIPNIKKIIHLDGDTLVFKDLWELFNLPFEGNYLLAQPTKEYIFKDKKMTKRVINVGVMLINIEKMRKDNKDFEILYYLYNKNFTEQLVLNYVCYPKIGYLPFKYGIFAGIHKKNNQYLGYRKMKLNKKVNITEVIEAIKDPSIVHVLACIPKYWYRRNRTKDKNSYEICIKFQHFFYFYAKQTNYYKIIYNKFMK